MAVIYFEKYFYDKKAVPNAVKFNKVLTNP